MAYYSRFKLFALEPCSVRLYLLSICLITLLSYTKTETCNDGRDLCQPLGDCIAYSQFVSPNYSRYKWCDISRYIVCCPQLQYNKPKIDLRNKIERPFEKDCKQWKETVYPTCPIEGLISQGKDARAREFPFMALIGILENSRYTWFCGGSLISLKFVLTAAHCRYDNNGKSPNRIRLGELDYNTTSDSSIESIQEFIIKNFTVHPNYNADTNYNDIALFELNEEVKINSNVLPICLPSTNGSEHDRLYAAGWGLLGPAKMAATHLQKVILERFEDSDCARKYGKDPYERPQGIIATIQICAGSYVDKRDTCQGDSGGPLFIGHRDLACMYEEQGITSFGTGGCGTEGSPGVYTRLLAYVDWIESIVWNVTKNDTVK